jgi:hypothetical protein
MHACTYVHTYVYTYMERDIFFVIDKGTEYLASFNTKTRQSPVALLQAYITQNY